MASVIVCLKEVALAATSFAVVAVFTLVVSWLLTDNDQPD